MSLPVWRTYRNVVVDSRSWSYSLHGPVCRTAALAVGFLAGWSLDAINQRANEVAAFVCTQPGATPALPKTLRSSFTVPRSYSAGTAAAPASNREKEPVSV